MVPGIDVSHYNGVIDWEKVAESGVKFAYIKCTDGAYWQDPLWSVNWDGARTAGLKVGSYHFLRPGVNGEQVKIFCEKLALGPLRDDLPPALDVELTGELPVLQCAQRIASELKRGPIIYTNFTTAESLNPDEVCAYPLWIAHYDTDSLVIPQAWEKWTFWQHTKTGSVPGIEGNVDLDWFNGDQADFDAFLEQAKGLPT